MSDKDINDIFDAASGSPDPADSLKNDQKDIKDIFQQAHDSPSAEEITNQVAAQGAQPGILGKTANFVKDLPTSAIDLIPGMKERRENIQDQRETAPSDIPGMTQAQRDQSFNDSANSAMNDPAMGIIGATGPTSWKDLLKGLTSLAGKAGVSGSKLETAGSKMAQEAMGMNSSKDLTSTYNPMTNKVERGSDIIKDTGTTAIDQGVLKGGTGNWYDNALNALETNYNKLDPILEATQSKLTPNLQQTMDSVGPITLKTPDVMQEVFDSVPTSSQRNTIIKKISQQYTNYEGKLAQADGNLSQLNDVKRELQTAAENLAPQIYQGSDSAKAEATLYKNMGGIVRQHIENLANAADPGAGDQIHELNKTIGNLSNMIPTLQKGTRGGIPTSWTDVGQKFLGPVEGFAAKGLNAASKSINTPIGPIAQEVVPQTARLGIGNPWSNFNSSQTPESDSTHITRVLSNATPESLKDVAYKFQQNPATKFCGDMLQKAVDDDDQGAKNRAIFCAAQIPQARALVTPSRE